MRETLEKRLGDLWGCVVIKYEMDILEDKLRFELRCNENGQYSYFEVVFEGVISTFYVYDPKKVLGEIEEDETDEDLDEFWFPGFEEIYYDVKDERGCISISSIIQGTELDDYYSKPNFTIFLRGYCLLLSIMAKSITINGEKFDNLI
jgi:hypothetical protein